MHVFKEKPSKTQDYTFYSADISQNTFILFNLTITNLIVTKKHMPIFYTENLSDMKTGLLYNMFNWQKNDD